MNAKHADKKSDQREHTPTPWGVRYQPTTPQFAIVEHGKDTFIPIAELIGEKPEGDATFIVRAVNSHEAMLGFLKEINDLAIENSHSVQDGYAMIAEWSQKAIAQAEGGR